MQSPRYVRARYEPDIAGQSPVNKSERSETLSFFHSREPRSGSVGKNNAGQIDVQIIRK